MAGVEEKVLGLSSGTTVLNPVPLKTDFGLFLPRFLLLLLFC